MYLVRLLATVFCCTLAFQATAQSYFDFKDWTVHVEDVDTGQDLRRTCTAATGGDGLPRLALSVSDGDAGPPAFYPVPLFEEYAPRGYSTQIDAGDSVIFEFDDGTGADTMVETGREDHVFPYAHVRPFPRDVLWMLQSMQSGATVTFYRSNNVLPAREHVYSASLSGFTAAYLKMMESCGFEPGAVLP
jgi:hypothetical protein